MKTSQALRAVLLLTIIAAIFAPTSVVAATATFTDEATFLASADPLNLESFEGETATNGFSSDVIALTDFTVTGTGPFSPTLGIWNVPAFGGFATDGINWLGYQTSDNQMLILDFSGPINSFGLDITDWGDFGTGTLVFSNDAGDFFLVDVAPNPNGNQQFFGVINDTMLFTTVTFLQDIFGEFYGVDNIHYGITTFAVEVNIDIKFCSDPNAFNCKKKGVLPVTIFGTEDFDIADIDISSLQLCTEDGTSCTNAPRDYSIADRGDPTTDLGAAMCAVIEVEEGIFEEQDYLSLDGWLDLDAAFEASEVQDMLGTFCSDVKGATSEPLVITGTTLDGTTIFSVPIPNLGTDQLWKVNK
jgi:hypothetical protein